MLYASFRRFHIHHTFLLREDVWQIFNRVYHTSDATGQDQFRLYMIFALSAVTRYRKGLTSAHPYGYYLAAQDQMDSISLVGSQDAIQNLLLISRFGMYHHIGTSLWEIAGFCIRQCIELGYHASPLKPVSALEEQKQRRIFWDCYFLDRYSSSILGRPFAIADEDISTSLPVDADDESIKQSAVLSLSDLNVSTTNDQPTELSVFIFCVKLRRISSAIHSEFYTKRRKPSTTNPTLAGWVHMRLAHFIGELKLWRQQSPIFPNPESLYQRSEWFDFLLEKEKLALVRGAMGLMPRSKNSAPESKLLEMTQSAAIQVIELYWAMLQDGIITWTRSYFQIIFTAGISIVHCLSLQRQRHANTNNQNESAFNALHLCTEILKFFGQHMVDARNFATVFNELKDCLLGRTVMHGQNHESARQTSSSSRAKHIWPNASQTPTITDNYSTSGEDRSWSLPTPEFDSNHLGIQTSMDGWPLLTADLMHDIEIGVGEYAWGWLGDEWFSITGHEGIP
jgi:hypothetical protein